MQASCLSLPFQCEFLSLTSSFSLQKGGFFEQKFLIFVKQQAENHSLRFLPIMDRLPPALREPLMQLLPRRNSSTLSLSNSAYRTKNYRTRQSVKRPLLVLILRFTINRNRLNLRRIKLPIPIFLNRSNTHVQRRVRRETKTKHPTVREKHVTCLGRLRGVDFRTHLRPSDFL